MHWWCNINFGVKAKVNFKITKMDDTKTALHLQYVLYHYQQDLSGRVVALRQGSYAMLPDVTRYSDIFHTHLAAV